MRIWLILINSTVKWGEKQNQNNSNNNKRMNIFHMLFLPVFYQQHAAGKRKKCSWARVFGGAELLGCISGARGLIGLAGTHFHKENVHILLGRSACPYIPGLAFVCLRRRQSSTTKSLLLLFLFSSVVRNLNINSLSCLFKEHLSSST